MTGGQVLSNNGSVRQPFPRVVGPPLTASSQSPHQVAGPAQPLTRPVRPQGDPGMHPGKYYLNIPFIFLIFLFVFSYVLTDCFIVVFA